MEIFRVGVQSHEWPPCFKSLTEKWQLLRGPAQRTFAWDEYEHEPETCVAQWWNAAIPKERTWPLQLAPVSQVCERVITALIENRDWELARNPLRVSSSVSNLTIFAENFRQLAIGTYGCRNFESLTIREKCQLWPLVLRRTNDSLTHHPQERLSRHRIYGLGRVN